MCGIRFESFPFLRRDLAYRFRRNTHHDGVGRNHKAFRHQGPGGDNGAFADDRAAQDRGGDTNDRSMTDDTTVYTGIVPDRDIIADQARGVGIAVNDRTVLDACSSADRDRIHVASKNRPVPDTGAFSNDDIADERGRLRDERSRIYLRRTMAIAAYQGSEIRGGAESRHSVGHRVQKLPKRFKLNRSNAFIMFMHARNVKNNNGIRTYGISLI